MAKKLSYADLLADRDHHARRAFILDVAYAEVHDAVYIHREGRDVYRWKAYRLTGVSGGYLVATVQMAECPRPRVYYVELLDTAVGQVQRSYSTFADCGMADAVVKFQNIRHELLYPAAAVPDVSVVQTA